MTPRDKTRLRARLSLIGALIAVVAALMSALQMQGRVRTVDILTLFAGGFAAGVGVIGAVVEMRRGKAQEPLVPGSPTTTTP